MKKLILYLAIILTLSSVPFLAYADKAPYEASSSDACSIAGFDDPLICGTGRSNEERELKKRIKSVLETVYLWVGIIAVIVIVIGGIKYMTSAGEAEKIKNAKHTITYAIIGLVVTLAAFAITEFVIGALEGRAPEGGGTHAEEGGGGGSESEEAPIKSIQMASKTTLVEGDTMQIKVKIIPDYATDRTISFTSSNTGVATVSSTGLLKAKVPGETTITATAKSGVKATMKTTVVQKIQVSAVELKPTSLSLKIGKTSTITATIKPKDAADKSLTWKSSDPKIATVDNNGKVTAKKEGKATVTAKSTNGKTGKTTVTVEPPVKTYNALFKRTTLTHSGLVLDYFINVPKGATSDMPLVMFLHGDGNFNNPNGSKNLPQAKYMLKSKKFISLIPIGEKNKGTKGWERTSMRKALKALYDKTIKEYESDKKRIYIWGYSRGSIGTWNLINHYPNFFAAAVPMSCGPVSSNNPKNFKNTPIWALVGANDTDYNRRDSMKNFVKRINAAGGKAKFQAVPGKNHSNFSSWMGNMSHNPNYKMIVDDWMLTKHK